MFLFNVLFICLINKLFYLFGVEGVLALLNINCKDWHS